LIRKHKADRDAARPHIELVWKQDYKPGLHVLTDGGRIFATDRELHYLDEAGATLRTAVNGRDEHRLALARPRPQVDWKKPVR
jgi:hypothetical protein